MTDWFELNTSHRLQADIDVVRETLLGPSKGVDTIYIQGAPGLGKTTLLNVAARACQNYRLNARHFSAPEFMRRICEASRSGTLSAFFAELSGADALLIDDLPLAANRATELNIALRLFTAEKKPLLVTADCAPEKLRDKITASVLKSLQDGYRIDLEPWNHERRLMLAQAHARHATEKWNVTLNNEVIAAIASQPMTPRAIIGLVTMAALYAQSSVHAVTPETLAKHIIGAPRAVPRPTIDTIMVSTSNLYNLTQSDFISPSRCRQIARPRQVAMYLSRQLTTRSLPEIGRRFGGRDHTTVLHACRRVEQLMRDDVMFKGEVELLRNTITAKYAASGYFKMELRP